MKGIEILKKAGDFAEDKDVAKAIRIDEINPEMEKRRKVELDFKGVTSATQSFVHALISQVIRDYGIEILDNISFKNCNSKVKTVIEIVVEYVQDGIFAEPGESEESSKPLPDVGNAGLKTSRKKKGGQQTTLW